VPEGDALHRAARRLQVLVGERVEVETPHPRAALKHLSEQLDGRRLDAVEAVGKNLLLRFEGGVVLRSHLRMNGRWRVFPRDAELFGRPWIVLRGTRFQAAQWNGPILELGTSVERRLGPDILDEPPRLDRMLANLRAADPSTWLGEALQRQRLVAGIGNMWMSEALWDARLSPWSRIGECSDDDLLSALRSAHRLMRGSLDGRRGQRRVYRRAGRPCPRCGTPIRSRGQGDDNRIAYWCPTCQAGAGPGGE
jgi:endonuclease-8